MQGTSPSRGEENDVRGFTLIELLVVVLIIGILAAVAVPQYQKAVTKARATQVLTVLDAYRKAMNLYLLEHGTEIVPSYSLDDLALSIEDPFGFEIGDGCSGDPEVCYYSIEGYIEQDEYGVDCSTKTGKFQCVCNSAQKAACIYLNEAFSNW